MPHDSESILRRMKFVTTLVKLPPDMLCTWSALVLAVAGAAQLYRANERIATDYEEYRANVQNRPNPGVQLPPLRGTDREGAPLTVTYDDPSRLTLVYVFSPACHYCNENWPNWSRLMSKARPEAVRIVAVDITGRSTADYIAQHHLEGLPLFRGVDYATLAAYNILAVPATLLVRPDGTVERSWKGVLSPEALGVLELAVQSMPESRDLPTNKEKNL